MLSIQCGAMRRVIIAFTLIFLALLAGDAYPGLRGGAGWRWPYEAPQHGMAVLILALVIALYLAGVLLLRRRSANTIAILAWAAGFLYRRLVQEFAPATRDSACGGCPHCGPSSCDTKAAPPKSPGTDSGPPAAKLNTR